MNTTIVKTVILLSGICVLLTGCASSPPTHFYTLEPVHTSEEAKPNSTQKKMLVGVGPVELPKLFDRTQIVTRYEDNRVELAEFHQWGEPLKENVSRVLTRNIAALRPNSVIRSYPWSAFGTVDYRVVVKFLQFDPKPGQTVTIEADWTIMNEKNHQILKNGHSKVKQTIENQSYYAIVEALNKSLGELSRELSSELDVEFLK